MRDLRLLRLLPFVAGILFVALGLITYSRDSGSGLRLLPVLWGNSESELAPTWLPTLEQDSHPIVSKIARANKDFEELMQGETFDLASAAHVYRRKRGRHPPPGFVKWWEYAKAHQVVMIEDLWDQIYDDLNPLWALEPPAMLQDVRAQDCVFSIRDGKAKHSCNHFWMPIWQGLINSIARNLPDLDIAMNIMDEPRLFVPREDMERFMEAEHKQIFLRPAAEMSSSFSELPKASAGNAQEFQWDRTGPLWPRIAKSCPADSEARLATVQTDFSQPPNLTTLNTALHTREGYVANYTLSTSLCHQPDLQGLHGFLIEAISISTSEKLFPLFGSSKLTVNSEILVPAAMYIDGDARFQLGKLVPWKEKSNSMVWRGLASGGRNKEDNWRGFHRHRLVSMLNGTQALVLGNASRFIDIQNLPLEQWHLQVRNETLISEPVNEAMGKWLQTWADVAFDDLNCFPRTDVNAKGCYYTDYLFRPSQRLTLSEQHHHKYLVDIDGNSFSGRYRDFISSGSLPIKSTIFREWHDSRLIAWKHFVPLDNRFLDIYGIMEFFLGSGVPTDSEDWNRVISARDLMAKKIALDGRDWAKKVLRVEDMRVYMYRLLLEYARVMDVRRDALGWVEDLESYQG